LAQSEYKKRHDIFAKIIHMNLAVKFNLLKDTQPHYIYKAESCLENDNYKLYFDRTVLTDIHIQHNRPDIILNKQQKQAYLLDKAVPNSHNITQTYNTKINKYLELSVAMRNLWCLEKNSILPFIGCVFLLNGRICLCQKCRFIGRGRFSPSISLFCHQIRWQRTQESCKVAKCKIVQPKRQKCSFSHILCAESQLPFV
jgi:hypothetical protein